MLGIVLFHFLIFLVIKAGATAIENVTVKEGETVTQLLNISDLKPISKLTIQKNFDNGTTLMRVCSSEEEKMGCKNLTSPRVSVQILDDAVSVTFDNVTDSDAGNHTIEVTGKNRGTRGKRFNIIVELPEIISSTQPPPSTPTKPINTSHNNTVSPAVIGIFLVISGASWFYFIWSIRRSCCRNS